MMRETHEIIGAHVGRRLKHMRGQRTQAQFAAELGLSQAQYNRYETGKRLAPDRVLEQVAEICGVSPRQVIWGDEDGAQADDLTRQVALLVEMLEGDDLEDLYWFLKNKIEQVAKRRKDQARQAKQALEELRAKAG